MPSPYRILVTGSRLWDDEETIFAALADAWRQTGGEPFSATGRPLVIVHGGCPTGADMIAVAWMRIYWRTHARQEAHPAQGHPTQDFGSWPAAGPRRNAHMVSLGADLCLAFIGPCTKPNCRRPQPHDSHGATNCAGLAEKAGIPTRRFTA